MADHERLKRLPEEPR